MIKGDEFSSGNPNLTKALNSFKWNLISVRILDPETILAMSSHFMVFPHICLSLSLIWALILQEHYLEKIQLTLASIQSQSKKHALIDLTAVVVITFLGVTLLVRWQILRFIRKW
jgi:hypothetical protein